MEPKRYQSIEREVLKLVLQIGTGDPAGYPATLPGLLTLLQQGLPGIPNISHREILDTLKRLRPKYLTLWKWNDAARRFIEYPTEISGDEDFFGRHDFRLRHTPDTDPYVQELEALVLSRETGHVAMGGIDNVPDDRRFAQMAIDEARKSVSEDGRPHPMVGAVVVKDGIVLGSAHRGEIAGGHAEYIVLEQKLSQVKMAGATVYTTLEPCTTRNHPKVPCATRLVERSVDRVVMGMPDPNPDITGRGQLELRRGGISIALFDGDLMAEVEELNREFRRAYANHSRNAVEWEVRYPGGLADVSIRRPGQPHCTDRYALGEDFTFINNSPHQVSLSITLLILYGCTNLAVVPRNLPLPEWEQLLTAFGIRIQPQLLFPLNLQGRSSIAGHILFPIRPEGQGKGIGGDVPEKRQYLFEIEDLQTKRKSTLSASAVYALDRGYHRRASQTDLAFAGPHEEPLSVD